MGNRIKVPHPWAGTRGGHALAAGAAPPVPPALGPLSFCVAGGYGGGGRMSITTSCEEGGTASIV